MSPEFRLIGTCEFSLVRSLEFRLIRTHEFRLIRIRRLSLDTSLCGLGNLSDQPDVVKIFDKKKTKSLARTGPGWDFEKFLIKKSPSPEPLAPPVQVPIQGLVPILPPVLGTLKIF
jgi:hypothetical protein